MSLARMSVKLPENNIQWFMLQTIDGSTKSTSPTFEAITAQATNDAFDLFVTIYQAKCPNAEPFMEKDRDVLLAFYSFPANHWCICG